jgi:hypothetical protein
MYTKRLNLQDVVTLANVKLVKFRKQLVIRNYWPALEKD